MDVQIEEVTTLKDLKAFIHFPFTLYRNNPYWVPNLVSDDLNTLRQDKNPAFETCEARYWLAYQSGAIVGRVAAILNHPHIEKWGQRYTRFGWLDFVDDLQVSSALLQAVETWSKESGMTAVHGPLGFTDMDREGMLVEGFDELATMATNYNDPYYPAHMEKLGYAKDIDWVEYEISMPPEPDEKIARMAAIVEKRSKLRLLEVRNKKEILEHGKELFRLLENEYQVLYGSVPLTPRQVDAYIKQYFGFITADFVPMVFNEKNEMVAFGVALPSLSRALQKSHGRLFPFGFVSLLNALKKNDRADLYLVAVKSEYRGSGANAILMNKMYQVFQKMGVKKIETNPELETNRLVQGQWKYFETRQHKRRRIFIKQLAQEKE
jgi:ribosomal protein S18 acetylase RimI-like enzyme